MPPTSAEVQLAAHALLSDDATGIGARVVAGELRAAALLEASLQRIGALNDRLGAVCWLAPQAGRDAARAVDEEVGAVAGRPDAQQELLARRPFAGVPFLLKDLGLAAVGLPSLMGSRLFGSLAGGPVQWDVDAELVKRYRAAGLVIFGRSATPELGISASTEARVYGRPTRNPWNLERSAGGSSGGAAAAVAGGLMPIAHASDGAGSIRIPASCCGLVGLKPSRALMPNGPLNGETWGGFATEHVLTHSVRDCALALAATEGADVGAAYAAPRVSRTALRLLAAGDMTRERGAGDGARQRPLRVGFIDSFFEGTAIDPRIAAAVAQVVQVLQDRGGHQVDRARIPVATGEIVETVVRTMACWTAAGIEAFCRSKGIDPAALAEDALEPSTWGALRLGQQAKASDYIGLQARTNRIARAVAAAVDGFDVIVLPVLAEPPAVIGRFAMVNPDYLDYRLGPNGLIHYSPFTPLANLTGQPALSLPLATVDGLPTGIQLIGRMGGDAELLTLAADLEQWLPWRGRRPDLPS
jgi:amidase